MNPTLYPPAPLNVSAVKPSAAFKKEVAKVTGSIVLFFVVYLLLIAAAVALAIACVYIGFMIIVAMPKFITLVAGLGLMALALSVIIFLVKFVFARRKDEDPSRVEIQEADYPELFAFIRQLAKDTQTQFPKKIFVSPAVNACVFYHSSFWSMFLPVRKNLEIGLGLVNTVNLSEFKAVMAHEFGHFSQQSMKLGSFTYNVNRVIYNMLYENTGYTNFLNSWGRAHGILSIFAGITAGIARGIQNILKEMYTLINKQYMGLSRQMEFNADAIAASVAGGNNLVTALNRLDLGSSSFNVALQKADEFLKDKMVSHNLFNNQSHILTVMAAEYNLPVENGLPQVTSQFIESVSKSRVNYKDQWASHPTHKERETELVVLQMNANTDHRSAWVLFDNAEAIQCNITKHVYRDIADSNTMQQYDNRLFCQRYDDTAAKYTMPELFGSYYDRRLLDADILAWDETVITTPVATAALLNEQNRSLQDKIQSNETDIETLKAIKDKRIDVKTFDFDGEKYQASSTDHVIGLLEAEIKEQQALLAASDKHIHEACVAAAYKGNKDLYQNACLQYQHIASFVAVFMENAGNIINTMVPFYHGGLTIEFVQAEVRKIKMDYEIKLKAHLRDLLADQRLSAHLPQETKDTIQTFMGKTYYYYEGNSFDNDGLELLYNVCTQTGTALAEARFAAYKNVAVQQAALLQQQ